jgi:hypothetical protein
MKGIRRIQRIPEMMEAFELVVAERIDRQVNRNDVAYNSISRIRLTANRNYWIR